jgi:3,4-dihydroxy 2-butanone 4-phosphate synthase/GTP cyclohydrolase II
MRQTLLTKFGTPSQRVEKALQSLKKGRGVIVTDDEKRENEGDLIFAAQSITVPQMKALIRDCSGIVCLCLTAEKARALDLPLMAPHNTSRYGTAFTISVDSARDITTGVSAADRVRTVQAAIADNAISSDLVQPGHMFPLIAVEGGVLSRRGHTEATVDLPRLAGLKPAGLLCELMNPDGSMMRLPEIINYAENKDLPVVTIEDLVEYRGGGDKKAIRVAESRLPTKYAEFKAIAFKTETDSAEHLALILGDLSSPEPVVVRIDSECVTGEIFGSLRCDCGQQMDSALQAIARAKRGILIFLRQEGRGIGLHNKIRAYALQDRGMDTVEANLALGFPEDQRKYSAAAAILADLGVHEIKLLTNNPLKMADLEKHGIRVTERVPLLMEPNPHNRRYMETKQNRMGHLL